MFSVKLLVLMLLTIFYCVWINVDSSKIIKCLCHLPVSLMVKPSSACRYSAGSLQAPPLKVCEVSPPHSWTITGSVFRVIAAIRPQRRGCIGAYLKASVKAAWRLHEHAMKTHSSTNRELAPARIIPPTWPTSSGMSVRRTNHPANPHVQPEEAGLPTADLWPLHRPKKAVKLDPQLCSS